MGLSTAQLARYIHGESAPALLPMVRLAEASGYSLEWIATGRGEPFPAAEPAPGATPAQIDADALQGCLEGLLDVQQELGLDLPPAKLAELAVILYEWVKDAETAPQRASILRLVKAAA